MLFLLYLLLLFLLFLSISYPTFMVAVNTVAIVIGSFQWAEKIVMCLHQKCATNSRGRHCVERVNQLMLVPVHMDRMDFIMLKLYLMSLKDAVIIKLTFLLLKVYNIYSLAKPTLFA